MAEPVKEYDKRKNVPYRGQVWKEDYVCQSTQGKIGYRNEQLATSDRGVILLRKRLMEAIETVQKGGVPIGVVPKAKQMKSSASMPFAEYCRNPSWTKSCGLKIIRAEINIQPVMKRPGSPFQDHNL